jgi:condensin complex subunit 3
MISQEALPSGLVTRCLDLLRTLSSSERDLIRVVVEVVHELRDANDDDEVIVRPSSLFPTTEPLTDGSRRMSSSMTISTRRSMDRRLLLPVRRVGPSPLRK